MQEIRVDEALWASSILPEGTVVRWLVADGAMVVAGKPIVEIRVENPLYEIAAPASGRLTIAAAANNVVELVRPTPARCAPRAKSSNSAGRLRRPKGASLMRGADFSLTPQRRVWCSRFRQPPPRVTVPVMQGRPVSGSSVSRASTSPLNPLQPITSYGPTIVLIVALCIDRGVRRFENATILFDRHYEEFNAENRFSGSNTILSGTVRY